MHILELTKRKEETLFFCGRETTGVGKHIKIYRQVNGPVGRKMDRTMCKYEEGKETMRIICGDTDKIERRYYGACNFLAQDSEVFPPLWF